MAEPFWLLGFILNNRRKYEEAKEFGKEAMELNSDMVDAYRVISFAASQLGNTSEAIEMLEKAYEKAKDDFTKADILYQRARTFQSVGDFYNACIDVNKALELDSRYEKAIRLRDKVCI